jgi:polysaccharide export outer membrane protein
LTLCLGSVGCHATVSFMECAPVQSVTPPPKLPPVLPEVAYRSSPDGRPIVNQSSYQLQEPPLANPVGGGVPAEACPTGVAAQAVPDAPHLPTPSEKAKTFLPAYVIEPPDVLTIDGIRLIPRPPYRIEPLDVLLISVPEALPNQPITGPYTVTPEGTVYLGTGYGAFRVSGLTLEQAAAAIKTGLRLNNPQVSVALGQFRGVQQVRGDHIVGQDGTITLGTFGCINVTGLTLSQAKCEIERHLSRWLLDPLVSVSISGYNSKVYYVITDGAGYGQQVYRLPITGNETVLDAISLINGLPSVSSKRHIWLARPTPAQTSCYEILPVNWEAITEAGSTETNWQIFPGDRVYVKADPFITFDNQLSKLLTPVERLLGATLLGTSTVQSFRSNNNNNGFNRGF